MEQEGKRKIRWKNSIQTKQIVGFTIIILIIIIFTTFLQIRAMEIATQATYEKMNAQAEYFLKTFENEISHVRSLQIEFFNDRKLPFLISSEFLINDYEKREALLSVRERLQSNMEVSDLVNTETLYLPNADYRITAEGIFHINEDDVRHLEEYVDYENGQIYYDGTQFLVIETGTPKMPSNEIPKQLLVISFSMEAIENSLSMLNTSDGSGAFFYNEENNLLIENSQGELVGTLIFNHLKQDTEGNYTSIQRIKANDEWYLVFVGGRGTLGLFVQYVKEAPIMQFVYQFRVYMVILVVLLIFMAFLFIFYTLILIHKPIHILIEAFANVKKGNWTNHIEHSNEDEFGYLYEGFNEMEDQINNLIDEIYVQSNLAQRAQLKQLQAQINPHFLYNSFFVLSRRVKRHDYENAEELAKHLGNYFQFISRNDSDFVPLRKEVEHAKSYAAIQATRFISRINVEFEELPEKYNNMLVPRLILQPLLENAFEHGLENKIEDGLLKVSFQENDEDFMVIVEDNGQEISEDQIKGMQEILETNEEIEITAIKNIHKRLQIFFKYQAGLRVARSEMGGVQVIIYIKKEVPINESEFIDCR